jgi:hypothetical protein
MVPASRRKEVEDKYSEIVRLETEYRADESNFYWETKQGGLTDQIIEGYRQSVASFRESEGGNDFSVKGMLSDLERRGIKFEGDPVEELKELLGKRKTDRIRAEIYTKLDELVKTAETYLHDPKNSEKKLKRELASELGTKYLAAEFEEIGNRHLGIKQKP